MSESLKKISLSSGSYVFEEVPLFYGRKKIDRAVCRDNLLRFKEVMDASGLRFGIIFGTLLGAAREQDFIEHDEDVDVYLVDADRQAFLDLLPEFEGRGFAVARYEGDLISLIRGGDYIDVYFFRKRFFGRSVCNEMTVPSRYFASFDRVVFLGAEFCAPAKHREFLNKMYGPDWMTPKQGVHASPLSMLAKLRRIVRNAAPIALVLFYRTMRARLKRR